MKASCYVARHEGVVKIDGREMIIFYPGGSLEGDEWYRICPDDRLLVKDGDEVRPGQVLAEWDI
jgi:hypothetical protein